MKRQVLTFIGCAVLLLSIGCPSYGEELPTEPAAEAAIEEILTETGTDSAPLPAEDAFQTEAAEETIEQDAFPSDPAPEDPDEVESEEHTAPGENALPDSAGLTSEEWEGDWCYDDTPETENLLDGYAAQKVNRSRGFVQSSFYAGRKLVQSAPGQASIYFLLKDGITAIADGQRSSSVFNGPISDLTEYGLIQKTEYTAQELGYDKITVDNRQEVFRTMLVEMNLDTAAGAVQALISDCPYELYWFNKSQSGGWSYNYGFEWDENSIRITSYIYRLSVAEEYAEGAYLVTSYYADTINDALETARQIVSDMEGFPDEKKLEAYRSRICDLASYHYEAAEGGVAYGNPWQMIWVFDRDSSTEVVCEGYAKAFSYLCELSSFQNGIQSYLVTGYMRGIKHMWNIVSINGSCYLVDVTNCDNGMIGAPTQLFLTGYDAGSVEDGYTIQCRSANVSYSYDSETLNKYSTEQLTLVKRGAEPGEPKNGIILDEDGVYRYYTDGYVDTLYEGVAEYRGGLFLVKNGLINTKAEGLTECGADWYYCSAGKVHTEATQLVSYNGAWFFVTKGVLDRSKEGRVGYDTGFFIVSGGQLHYEYTGLWQDPATMEWAYYDHGQFWPYYSGEVEYDGHRFLVENGLLVG